MPDKLTIRPRGIEPPDIPTPSEHRLLRSRTLFTLTNKEQQDLKRLPESPTASLP